MSMPHLRQQHRPGAILFVVVACLALFLSVGIAFVFYANQQAISMRYSREASGGGRASYVNQGTRGSTDEAPPLPTDLFNMALGQLIYDVPDDANGVFGAMYGHSLARSMYGWNSTLPLGNTTPYDGFGRPGNGTAQYGYINYTGVGSKAPEKEYGGYIAKNAPYTYPDENNCFLAAIDPTTGKVWVPSFHRPWLTGPNLATADKRTFLRPNSADNPNFPLVQMNADNYSYGDVENLEGKSSRQLDSIWIDLDAPVRHWRGRMYKPMFAFLVTDMDGRINPNVAGNVKNSAYDNSNQGWGPWEMALGPVMNGTAQTKKVLDRRSNGAGPTASYSIDGGATTSAISITGPAYSGIDFDSYGSTKYNFPLAQYFSSPTWGGRYDFDYSAEAANSLSMYNSYLSDRIGGTRTKNVAYDLTDAFYLNYKFYGDSTNYQASKLGPDTGLTASTVPSPALNYRYLLSPFTNDLQRPGARAWVPNTVPAGANYQQATAGTLPVGGPIPAATAAATSPRGDFDPSWRSLIASALGSIDLNRKLSDYRSDPTGLFETPGNVTAASAARAVADRQALAMDIFVRLLVATGAVADPRTLIDTLNVHKALLPLPQQQLDACRRLAQIAVNIVDYTDLDDYVTPFNWNNNPAYANMSVAANVKAGWVFGTEMPRLVINEVYAMWDNTNANLTNPPMMGMPKKPFADQPYPYQIYAELHNPLTMGGTYASPYQAKISHGGGAPLVYQGQNVYQLVIIDPTNATKIHDADNVLGDPDNVGSGTTVAPLGDASAAGFKDANNNIVVPTSNHTIGSAPAGYGQKGGNPAFYVIGPKNVENQLQDLPGDNKIPLSFECPQMSLAPIQFGSRPKPQVLLLRRLLCPHLPPSAATNPYITVDYFFMDPTTTTPPAVGQKASIWDHRKYLSQQEGGGTNNAQQKFGDQYSYGRTQPFAAAASELRKQTGNPAPTAGQDTHFNQTFYKHNDATTLKNPFDWLVHLDRTLISPIEIACVSAWKPHELTQRFVVNGQSQQHMANWNNTSVANAGDANAQRLYRAFGLLETRNRTYGLGFGGRVPGMINLNTVWDEAVLQSLATPDVTGVNDFTANDVKAFWTKISSARSITGNTIWNGTPRPNGLPDNPILPTLGADYSDATHGVQNTIVGMVPAPTALAAPQHPYQTNEMLTKIYNKVTTRSNSFSVWCTIGYFEVTNPGPYSAANRPKLGKELGGDDGTNIRHKFFALIDRTNLTLETPQTPASTLLRRLSRDTGPCFFPMNRKRPIFGWTILILPK